MVTECAAKGAATGPGDCDLNGMQSVTSDASGQVKIDLTVTKGPFGANNIVCGPAQACLISVTQATRRPPRKPTRRSRSAYRAALAATTISRAMIVTSAARPGALARG